MQPSPLAFETEEFYLKSEAEMRALFPGVPEAFDNTAAIAGRCRVELEFGKTQLPAFDAPGGDSAAFFRRQCEEGLRRRYGENPPQALRERLEYEMDTVERMGYVDYYLIVNDFVQYAKSHDIPVGPGRGSGAGSLCAYCIGITGIDPIQYNLLFERFLNPERVSMPDFDIDFCNEKRQQVIDYVIDKYGADRVAQIITFGTMAARAAIRDVARAMAMSLCGGGSGGQAGALGAEHDPGSGADPLQAAARADGGGSPGAGADRDGPEGGGDAPPCLHPCGGGGDHRQNR